MFCPFAILRIYIKISKETIHSTYLKKKNRKKENKNKSQVVFKISQMKFYKIQTFKTTKISINLHSVVYEKVFEARVAFS